MPEFSSIVSPTISLYCNFYKFSTTIGLLNVPPYLLQRS